MDAADRDVPRVDDHADLALGGVGRVDDLATLEAHAREAVVERLHVAAKEVRAGERGHERVVRLRDELGRRAELAQLALDEHADRAGERGGVLVVVGDDQRRQLERLQQLLQLERGRRPSCARRAPRAARRAAARRGRARAPAPARRAAVLRPRARPASRRARCEMRKRSSSSATRALPPKATFRSTLRCGKSAYSWKTRPTRRSSGRRGRRPASSQTSPSSAIRPVGRASPAIARRTELLPAPEGPTSATVRSTSRASLRSNERRGSSKSVERVAT